MAELNLNAGDLVEVYNANGSTQAMAHPTSTAKRKQTFMLFAYPTAGDDLGSISLLQAGIQEWSL